MTRLHQSREPNRYRKRGMFFDVYMGVKQFWPLSHEKNAAKTDQLKIFDEQKIENVFFPSFIGLNYQITIFRTKIWTFHISSTAKMYKFEKLLCNGPSKNPSITDLEISWWKVRKKNTIVLFFLLISPLEFYTLPFRS